MNKCKIIMVSLLSAALISSCAYINSEIYRKQTGSLYREGKRAYDSGKYKSAKEKFAALLEKDAEHPEANFAMGAVLYVLGEYEQAKLFFGKVLTIDSDNQENLTWLAETYIRLQDIKNAEKLAENLPAKTRSVIREKIQDAEKMVTRPVELEEREIAMLSDAAELIDERRYAEAAKPLERILNKNPDHLTTNIYYIITNLMLDRIKEADAAAKKILIQHGGRMYPIEANTSSREKILNTIENTSFKHDAGYSNLLLGLLLVQNSKPGEYHKRYLKGGLKHISSKEIGFSLSAHIGDAFWRLQEVDEALRCYELSLKKKPNQIRIMDQLAHIYLLRMRDRKKAIALAKSILEIEPEHLFANQIIGNM